MYTDKFGHVYYSNQELDARIKFLEDDAEYLREQADRYKNAFIRQGILDNARRNDDHVKYLRSLRTT